MTEYLKYDSCYSRHDYCDLWLPWIDQGRPSIVTATVTPFCAEALLSRNSEHNELRLSDRIVQKYAEEMRTPGRWKADAATIDFNVNGQLVNGQHRLRALVKANVILDLTLRAGVSAESFAYMDQGYTRTSIHIRKMQGKSVTSFALTTAKTVGLYYRYPNIVWSNQFISSADILDFYTQHEDSLASACKAGERVAGRKSKDSGLLGRIPAAPVSAAAFIIAQDSRNLDRFDEWVNGIAVGEMLKIGDPRKAIRDCSFSKDIRWGSYNQSIVLSFLKSWNCFVSGQSMQIIRVNRNALPMPKAL